jgi:hypothetical protein
MRKEFVLDYSKINGKVQEETAKSALTRCEIAGLLHISYKTFCLKLVNPEKGGAFTPFQVVTLAKVLNIPNEQLAEYFFTPKVENSQPIAS